MSKKEDNTTKEFLDAKAKEIMKMYDLDEIEEVGGESRVLEIGDHICGEYKGIEKSTDNEGNEIDLIKILTDSGLFTIKQSYQLGSVTQFEINQKIAILCYDLIKTESGRQFKKYKIWKVK